MRQSTTTSAMCHSLSYTDLSNRVASSSLRCSMARLVWLLHV